jgi:hypothetical protein
LKKCIPTTRSGWLAPAATAVTGSDEVVVAQLLEQRMLEREPLRRSLDHQVTVGERLERGRGGEPLLGLLRLLGVQAPARSFARKPVAGALHAALERIPVRVPDQCVGTAPRGELGDSRAHRAGADDGDAACGVAHASGGTIALTPVAARPMINFWICEVPS